MKKIVLTGGGTAGHIMPNVALLGLISKNFDKIYYLGTKNSMEERIMSEYKNVEFIAIPTTKLVRSFKLSNFAIPFKLIHAIMVTKKILKKIKPDVIFSKGGFVSVPVAIAGKKCGIPVISHESDLSMGLANKIILRYAKAVCVSFEQTAKISPKCIFTGSPVRDEVKLGNKAQALREFKGYNPALPTVLFFGGSLGSKNINTLVENSIQELTKKYNVVHIVGKNNKKVSKPIKSGGGLLSIEFAKNIQDFFALADVVVCRGGANSLFELLALKKPMLIIPLSKAQSRGDQIENAKYFKDKSYAEVLFEEDMNTLLLMEKINSLIKDGEKYKNNMSKSPAQNANQKIVEIIKKYVKEKLA